MKYTLSIIAIFMTIHISSAQDIKVDTIYYDNNWKVVSSKYIADYYRVKIDLSQSNDRQFRDYYITGEQQGRGNYIYVDSLSDNNSIFDGRCITYYKNGNTASEQTYIDGKLSGEYIEYNQNGLIKRHANFTNGMLNGIHTEFDNDNNCTQIEYEYDVPADYYTKSNSDGCMMTYNTSDGEPIWLSPSIDENKIKYKDGVKWQYYVKNGLTIFMANSEDNDYGKYYKIDLVIVNDSFEPIEFDPVVNMSACVFDERNNILNCEVLSSEEYIKKVRNRQNWNSVLVGALEGFAAAGAGYSTSTTTTSSYTTGSVSTYGVRGGVRSSYSGSSMTTSTTQQYDAAAAYQARVIASDRIANFNSAQLTDRNIRNEEYFKRTTINPSEVVVGSVYLNRKTSDKSVKVNIDINGAEYHFGVSGLLSLSSMRRFEINNRDTILLKSYSSDKITYKTKQEQCKIKSIDIYNKYTLVTFSYVNLHDENGFCSIDPDAGLMYLRTAYYTYHNSDNPSTTTTVRMIKAENAPLIPDKYHFNYKGEELIFQIYFPPIPVETSQMDITVNRKDKMRWKSIILTK